jgi:hypothetical protein
MPQHTIFGPFLATMLLTGVVWVYMYSRRIPFIVKNRIGSRQLAMPGELARLSPPNVATPADNLRNLFEVPVIFYALALYLFVTQQVDLVYVYAAWVFFVFRAAHSAIHCTFNRIMWRFYVYAISTAALWFMVIRAVLAHLFATAAV